MNSLHNVAVLVAVVALLGAVGATTSLQQASGQGIIVINKEKFNELTTNFEMAVSDAADKGDKAEIQRLLDEYNRNVMMVFEIEPLTDADPPGEATPPEPDTEPPQPDKS
jgi:hypothetical protein